MTPAVIIHAAAHWGVTLRVDGADLVYRGPRGALCPELMAALKAHKPAIISELMGADTSSVSCPGATAARLEFEEGLAAAHAERQALRTHGIATWQALADDQRVAISGEMDRLPPTCNFEASRLQKATCEFLGSPLFDRAVSLGWDMTEIFGLAADMGRAPVGAWGLIPTLVLVMLSGTKIKAVTEIEATLLNRSGLVRWPRFRPEISACVLWWECPEIVQPNER